jgi:phosphoserine aminotransferase
MVKELGGIAAVEKLNNAKTQVLYTEIIETLYLKELLPLQIATMNATFLLKCCSCRNI